MPHKLFVIIPAAGQSRRMGRPKLLLPLGKKTVIARLLEILDRPDITDCLTVLRKDDTELLNAVSASSATPILPAIDPPDMRNSVEQALKVIRHQYTPDPDDGWILIPADHPILDTEILDELIDCWERNTDLILVPTCDKQRGHPTFFRWKLAEEVFALPADQGLNQLLKRHADDVVEFPLENPAILTDLDTPEDYQKLSNQWKDV